MSYCCMPESAREGGIDRKTREDARARFGFAFFDVENPTAKGLEISRDPESAMLMSDLHRFWRGERTLQDDLVQRLRYAEGRNPLLARMDPRMSQVVALSASPGEPLAEQAAGVGQRALLGGALGALVLAYLMPKEARTTGVAVGGMLGALAAISLGPSPAAK